MTVEEMIAAIQKKLGVQVDGRAGTETWGAIYAHIVKPRIAGREPAAAIDAVDERSERNIATLESEVRPIARALVHKAASHGLTIKVIGGTRSFDEQDRLFAQGRTTPGMIVTKARGGFSNHNFGIAFDVGVFEGSRYLSESVKYKAVGALGEELGLEWGGRWTSIVDQPHFQLRPEWALQLSEKVMLAQLRLRAADDSPVFA